LSTICFCRDLNVLSEEDWLEVKQAIEILHIFNEVTIEISSEKTVSVSKIPVFVHTMHRHISSEKFPDQDLKPACSSMIVVLRKELTERFDGYEDMEIIAQATLLDPRFKKFGFYSTDKYKKTLEHLRNRLKFSVSQPVNPVVFAPQSQHTVHSVSSSSNPSSLWAEFDLGVQENIRQQDPRAAVVLEIDRYIKEPLIPRTEDPLKWWKSRQAVYPTLYNFVKKRLCIPATSVPSERIFSRAGQVLTEKRNRLKGAKVSKILFLSSNI
jgi:hypothetical protein